MIKNNLILLITASFVLFALSSCAPEMRNFGFEFGMLDPNKDVEILDWRYGNSTVPYSHAPSQYLVTGHIPQSDNIHGTFPSGDVLYVKWRVRSTGKIYEDTADLHSSLPWDMNNKTIHFAINESQLTIYLIEYVQEPHAVGAPDCPAKLYRTCKCTRIYPDHWKNF